MSNNGLFVCGTHQTIMQRLRYAEELFHSLIVACGEKNILLVERHCDIHDKFMLKRLIYECPRE